MSNTQRPKKESYITLDVEMEDYYRYKSVPAIRLMGQWLEAAGFHIGDPVLVKCKDREPIMTGFSLSRSVCTRSWKSGVEKAVLPDGAG